MINYMQSERSRNASRNIVFGFILKTFQIIIPFLMRTAMNYYMGTQYLGLGSLFTSVLQVLNLAELGVGSAMVYSMYKPIVEEDVQRICALLRLYRRYYTIIGIVIAVLGLCLLPFVPFLIHDTIPEDINIYILYLFFLSTTVISYLLFAYQGSLFFAHQRGDITSKVSIGLSFVQYFVQFYAVIAIKNYYFYSATALVIQIVTNIIIAFLACKCYPDYKPKGELPLLEKKYINQRIRDLFTSKIGSVVVNSVDTIVISSFLGLTILTIYHNYFYILSSIIGIVDVIFVACTAGIGNSLIVETKEKNYNDLKTLTFIMVWIASICTACLWCLYQPFMRIWMGDKLLLDDEAVICLCIYYFIYEINRVLNTYKDAGGIWRTDRFRPLVTAMVNLCMNLIMVQFMGIYGVLLSTVLSMLFVGMPWLINNLFTDLFERKMMKEYVFLLFKYLFVTCIVSIITYVLCKNIEMPGISGLFVRGLICVIFPNCVFILIYRNNTDFVNSVLLLDRITKGKLKLKMVIK